MRTRPTLLSKTCPYCGARSIAEAKLPIPANMPAVEFNLDDLGALVEKQSLSLLLALVELLPYKTFTCRKCQGEFRMESRATRDLVRNMLSSMRPVIPDAKPKRPTPPKARPAMPAQPAQPRQAQIASKEAREKKADWESESLDALFDYSVDPQKK